MLSKDELADHGIVVRMESADVPAREKTEASFGITSTEASFGMWRSTLRSQSAFDSERGHVPQPAKRRCRLCCGCCRQDSKSSVVQDLQAIERKIRGNEPKGRWPWVDSVLVNMLFGSLIALNSLCIGVDLVTAREDGSSHPLMVVLESIFLITFWVEIVLRMVNVGARRFVCDFWGPFDFGVTLLGSLDAWLLAPIIGSNAALSGLSALRTLRLLRLMRLLRLFRAFKELAKLVQVLIQTFSSLAWVSMLLLLLLYVSAIVVLLLLGRDHDDPEMRLFTQTIGWNIFYQCTLVTAEGHLDMIVYPTTKISELWYAYWVPIIIVFNFFMVNMMVGLIVQRTLLGQEEEDHDRTVFVYEAAQFKKTLLELFSGADVDEHGQISTDELCRMMDNPKFISILSTFGINLEVPHKFFLTILGFHDEKYISFKRFFESCVRICGASRDMRSFMLQYDISELYKDVRLSIRTLSKELGCSSDGARDSFAAGPSPPGVPRPLSLPIALTPLPPAPLRTAPPPPPVGRQQDGFGKGLDGTSVQGKSSSSTKRKIRCNPALGGGFGANFQALAYKAKKKLASLERRQEELLLSLCELRVALLGPSHPIVICCKRGHPLMSLGTAQQPVGSTQYQHWTCDNFNEPGGCRHGSKPGSHLTMLRRYHCRVCRYDICEDCYIARLCELGVGKLSRNISPRPDPPLPPRPRSPIQPASRSGSRECNQAKPPPPPQPDPPLRSDTPPCEGPN